MASCECCGQTIKKARKKARTRRLPAITLGKGPSKFINQRAEYDRNRRIKRGELVWSPWVNYDRFGASGDFVAPELAAELAAKAARGGLWRQQVAQENGMPKDTT